jgi:hypothetical protein
MVEVPTFWNEIQRNSSPSRRSFSRTCSKLRGDVTPDAPVPPVAITTSMSSRGQASSCATMATASSLTLMRSMTVCHRG